MYHEYKTETAAAPTAAVDAFSVGWVSCCDITGESHSIILAIVPAYPTHNFNI